MRLRRFIFNAIMIALALAGLVGLVLILYAPLRETMYGVILLIFGGGGVWALDALMRGDKAKK